MIKTKVIFYVLLILNACLPYCKKSSFLLDTSSPVISGMIRENTYMFIMLTLVVIPLNDSCSRKLM